MAQYSFYNNAETAQTKPVPTRETEMIKGGSGGYAFEADIWEHLRRCLIMGTSNGSYYSGLRELTDDFRQTVEKAIAIDPARVAQEIFEVSDEGLCTSNSHPLFALVLLSMATSSEAKQGFREIHPKVVRTMSHFLEWLSYTRNLRGMGRVIREAGRAWLTRDELSWLTYQFLKYKNRQGYTTRDVLRLFKPQGSKVHSLLYGWATGQGIDISLDPEENHPLGQLLAYEAVKAKKLDPVEGIIEYHLTHEMITGIVKMDQGVWQALFTQMPLGALLRNLGSLTEIGVINFAKTENLDLIERKLTSKERLKQARIHPIDILKALKIYISNGRLGRSNKTWVAVPRVVDILEAALELSFETIASTGKRFLHAVDISGSMDSYTVDSVNLTCAEIAAAMALVTAKAETNYLIRGFSTSFIDLGITKRDTFDSALRKTTQRNFGGTDASVAYDWAIANKVQVDVFCFWTDAESWSGNRHPFQAFQEYRAKVNPDAIAVYNTLVPNKLTLADPKDDRSYNFAGFDPSIPKLIQTLANSA